MEHDKIDRFFGWKNDNDEKDRETPEIDDDKERYKIDIDEFPRRDTRIVPAIPTEKKDDGFDDSDIQEIIDSGILDTPFKKPKKEVDIN